MMDALKKAFARLKQFVVHSEEEIARVFQQIESDAPQIESYSEEAIPVLNEILTMIGGKTAAEVQSVIDKFGLHFTAEVADDPAQLNSLITTAATKALINTLPPTVSPTAIQLGVTTALHTLTISQAAQAASPEPAS